ERGSQRLRSTHPAQASTRNQFSRQIALKMFPARRRKSLIRALKNSLRADVNPAAGCHLAVHHQPRAIEFIKMFPIAPVAYQVRIGDQHARSIRMSPDSS